MSYCKATDRPERAAPLSVAGFAKERQRERAPHAGLSHIYTARTRKPQCAAGAARMWHPPLGIVLQPTSTQERAPSRYGEGPLAPHSLSPAELKRVLAAEREGGPF